MSADVISISVDLPIETEFHEVAVLSQAPGRGTPVACIAALVTGTPVAGAVGIGAFAPGRFAEDGQWRPRTPARTTDRRGHP